MPELGILSGASGKLTVLVDWTGLNQTVPQWQPVTARLDDSHFASHGDFARWRDSLLATAGSDRDQRGTDRRGLHQR